MADTNISWTNAVWNPVTGCTKVSPGCKNCYAEAMTERFYGKNSFENIVLHPDRLDTPLHWKKPRMIFVNSMSDLFHENIPFEFIDRVFAVMALCPQHTFQILTKRPERMREYMSAGTFTFEAAMYSLTSPRVMDDFVWPLPNVWLGVSVENQKYADERIPLLLQTPAAIRFVSAEPLLGEIRLVAKTTFPPSGGIEDWLRFIANPYAKEIWVEEMVSKIQWSSFDVHFRTVDWVIVGGESGANRRECNPEWIQSIADQCRDAGVACFVKQDSGLRPGKQGRLSDELWSLKQYPKRD